jgi:outer membrane protein
VGAEARLNLFRGFSDRARLERARAALARRAVEHDAALSRARLEVRAAMARQSAAAARLQVAEAAVTQAREAQRIVRDRYDNGLAEVVALLQAAEAVLDAESRVIGARADVAVQHARLEVALGR